MRCFFSSRHARKIEPWTPGWMESPVSCSSFLNLCLMMRKGWKQTTFLWWNIIFGISCRAFIQHEGNLRRAEEWPCRRLKMASRWPLEHWWCSVGVTKLFCYSKKKKQERKSEKQHGSWLKFGPGGHWDQMKRSYMSLMSIKVIFTLLKKKQKQNNNNNIHYKINLLNKMLPGILCMP